MTTAHRTRICITRRGDDFHACLAGQRAIWGCGTNSDAAIGSLVRAHSEEFAVEILPTLGRDGKALEDPGGPAAETTDDPLEVAQDVFRRASRIMLDWPTPDAQNAVHLAAVALRKLAEVRGRRLDGAPVYLDMARAAVEQVAKSWEIAKIHRDRRAPRDAR